MNWLIKFFKKPKYKLPFWLFLCPTTQNCKVSYSRIMQTLEEGKSVIILVNGSPVKINPDLTTEQITNYTIGI